MRVGPVHHKGLQVPFRVTQAALAANGVMGFSIILASACPGASVTRSPSPYRLTTTSGPSRARATTSSGMMTDRPSRLRVGQSTGP